MTDGYTHDELVERARKWLAGSRKCGVVVTELTSGRETADALGWTGTFSVLVECKTSRSDFLTDKKKPFRRNPAGGMGHKRYYLAPAKVVDPKDLPEGWGLLRPTKVSARTVVEARAQPEWSLREELATLLSTLRRLKIEDGEHCSIRSYTHQTKCTATLTRLLVEDDT